MADYSLPVSGTAGMGSGGWGVIPSGSIYGGQQTQDQAINWGGIASAAQKGLEGATPEGQDAKKRAFLDSMSKLTDDQWAQYSQFVGYDLKSSFQQYANGIGVDVMIASQGMPPDASTFVNNAMKAKAGQWWPVIQSYLNAYESSTGSASPAGYLNQLLGAINSSPPSVQQSILSSAGIGGAAGVSTSANNQFLTNIYNTWSYSAPSNQQYGYQSAYQKALGKPMTEEQLSAIKGMDPQQFQQWMDNQPYQGGLNYGTYTNQFGSYNHLWQQYFGHDMTASDVAYTVGRTAQDIQDFINQSPSHVAGVNIGSYENLVAGANKNSNELFGHDADQSMINLLSSAMK